MDLSALSEHDQEKVRSVLLERQSVFAVSDLDLGCTNLITHDIPLLDDAPVDRGIGASPPLTMMKVQYLGHVVSGAGISTDQRKIAAVAEWAPPGTVAELRSFLGFISYYQRFVEGFAKLAGPLHKLVADLIGKKNRCCRGIVLRDA